MSNPVPLTPAVTAQSSQPSQRQVRYDLAARVAEQTQIAVMQDEAFLDANFGTNATLPEKVFRANFLPIITGEAFVRQPNDEARQRLAVEAENLWLRVAGSAAAEVDVVEEDGTVAFTVPASVNARLIDTSQSMRSQDRQLRHDNEDYIHNLSINPEAARVKFTSSLSARLGDLLRPEVAREEDLAKLAKMRAYYGLKPVDGAAPGAAGGSSTSAGEMSFDD